MSLLICGVFFILGAVIASFVGVVVARLSTGVSIVLGRSQCDACGVALSPFALVPILSYLASRGKALCCGSRISPAAPLSEVVLGALFVLAYRAIGLSIVLPFSLIALSALLALVLYDLAHQILPAPILTLFVIVSAVSGFLASSSTPAFLSTLVVAFVLAACLAAIHFLSSGRAMGFADAPLTLGLALLVGPLAFSGFVYSFWIGAVIGIVLLVRRPVGSIMKVEVPFAPFLAAGFLLAYFTQWNLLTLTGI